jgi:hypothetical protein
MVCYKIMEYQSSNIASVLVGLVTAQIVTQRDQNGDRAAKFKEQIKEGIQLTTKTVGDALR